LTNCVPIWGSDREKFYGSYCLDQFPSAADNKFIRQFFPNFNDDDIVDYMIFNDEFDYDERFSDLVE
jgi:hypothetical protein